MALPSYVIYLETLRVAIQTSAGGNDAIPKRQAKTFHVIGPREKVSEVAVYT